MAFELINFYEVYIDEIMLLTWKDVNGFVLIFKINGRRMSVGHGIVNGVWVLLYFKLKIKKSNIYENHAIECY